MGGFKILPYLEGNPTRQMKVDVSRNRWLRDVCTHIPGSLGWFFVLAHLKIPRIKRQGGHLVESAGYYSGVLRSGSISVHLASGKRLQSFTQLWRITTLIGKSTISMGHFQVRKLLVYRRVVFIECCAVPEKRIAGTVLGSSGPMMKCIIGHCLDLPSTIKKNVSVLHIFSMFFFGGLWRVYRVFYLYSLRPPGTTWNNLGWSWLILGSNSGNELAFWGGDLPSMMSKMDYICDLGADPGKLRDGPWALMSWKIWWDVRRWVYWIILSYIIMIYHDIHQLQSICTLQHLQ